MTAGSGAGAARDETGGPRGLREVASLDRDPHLLPISALVSRVWRAIQHATHDVCGLTENARGLGDMSGNVFGGPNDWYDDDDSSATASAAAGPSSGASRVFRGDARGRRGGRGRGQHPAQGAVRARRKPT